MLTSTDNGPTALSHVPVFVSARSANTLISENRPTRIQAETLLVLNGLLDELLLMVLTSAKSLATDRIKTDGMLRVLNNNPLAKNAVLEAELELRSYVDGKRAEGAKVPLGLMATSRLDGTDGFPVQSAYRALRTGCQYYSTLADSQDDSAAKDQNIMSSDGRPIATVTSCKMWRVSSSATIRTRPVFTICALLLPRMSNSTHFTTNCPSGKNWHAESTFWSPVVVK